MNQSTKANQLNRVAGLKDFYLSVLVKEITGIMPPVNHFVNMPIVTQPNIFVE